MRRSILVLASLAIGVTTAVISPLNAQPYTPGIGGYGMMGGYGGGYGPGMMGGWGHGGMMGPGMMGATVPVMEHKAA